jgi:hypothetical protein
VEKKQSKIFFFSKEKYEDIPLCQCPVKLVGDWLSVEK